MLGSTVRRTSTSSERSLDPAYVADDAHGQYPSDCPASRSISPSKTSLDRLLTTPLATLATSETATLEAAAAPDGEKGGGADEEGEKLDKLEKLGETVKKEGGSNQLVITIPQLSNPWLQQHHLFKSEKKDINVQVHLKPI